MPLELVSKNKNVLAQNLSVFHYSNGSLRKAVFSDFWGRCLKKITMKSVNKKETVDKGNLLISEKKTIYTIIIDSPTISSYVTTLGSILT